MELEPLSAIGPAFERTQRMLFSPFDFKKWLGIGFVAWLAHLGEGGGGQARFAQSFNNNGGTSGFPSFSHAANWVVDHLAVIVLLALVAYGFLFLVWLAIAWLSSRARLMFVAQIAEDSAAVAEPWERFADLGGSLFKFRVALALIGALVLLPALAGAAVILIPAIRNDTFGVTTVVELLGIGFALMVASIPLMLIQALTTDFVVPVMYLRNALVLDAWRETRTILGEDILGVIVYFVVKAALSFVTALVAGVATCLTCCLAGLPFLGTLILLPIPVFFRAWTLEMLGNRGGDFARLRSG